MSANNCYVVLKHKNKYYGFDQMAEASMNDKPDRVLHASKTKFVGDTVKKVIEQLAKGEYLSPEYGVVTDNHPYLPKDGTRVRIVE